MSLFILILNSNIIIGTLLKLLPQWHFHLFWCRDDVTYAAAETNALFRQCISSNPNTIQRANTIHCDSEMTLLPNLPKSQYHTLWCWDDAVTKSVKEPIPSIVMQGWCYYQICQRANIIQCDAEMMLLPNLPRSMQTVHTISLILMKLFVVYFTIPIKIACHCFNFIVKNSDCNKSVKIFTLHKRAS